MTRQSHSSRASGLGLTLALLTLLLVAGCRREVVIPDVSDVLTAEARELQADDPGGSGAAPSLRRTQVVLPPTATPTRVPPETTATVYTVRAGDTLLRIAVAYGTTVESLMQLNGLTDADQLAVGQRLQVSMDADHKGPGKHLVPDSELVFGPGYADFDIATETARHPGLLAQYTETVNGRDMTGAEIIALVSEQYSIGPRVLLTLLELHGGWLSNPEPSATQRLYPLGYDRGVYWEGLYLQLCQAANGLNTGFYGWRLDTLWLVQTADGAFIEYSADLNAGTAGIQKALADTAESYEAWLADIARFSELYGQLYGDPFDLAVEPLLPPDTAAPPLELPWAVGETWYYTGGPHPGWGTQGALAALDFVTDERNIGCAISQRWVEAAAGGLVVMSEDGMVLQDLDGDGFAGTGWVILYMHVGAQGRVAEGAELTVGDPIGHPSCEGGVSDASHLHLARRVNGVWVPADDPSWPMSLSGWVPTSGADQYEGTLVKGEQVVTACECWEALNAVRH